jgi:hypothetical protein
MTSVLRFPSFAVLCTALLGPLACSAEVDSYGADAESGSTHALISVERSTSAEGASHGTALAGFVRMPAHVDARSLMTLVGLGLELPEPGRCSLATARPSAPPLSSLRDIELLAAGDVSLDSATAHTALAPRAFPTVTDSISGVMYTTRDRSSDALPAGLAYSLRIRGGSDIAPLTVDARAPADVEGATIGGVPFADLEVVSTKQPIDLTWPVGDAGDLVYAQLSSDDAASTVCTFRDELGAGSIAAGTFAGTGGGYVSLHRVRVHEFRGAGIDRGQLRFNFEVARDVTFVD